MINQYPWHLETEEDYQEFKDKNPGCGYDRMTNAEINQELNKRREAYTEYRAMWDCKRTLTEQELGELLSFEFEKGPSTISEQVRRYYLKLKLERSQKAGQMQDELKWVFERDTHSLEDIRKICNVISKYISGFIIDHKGETYTEHSTWIPKRDSKKESRLVQISEEEAEKMNLKPINLSGRGFKLSHKGCLMLTVPPADGGITSGKSIFELTPEGLEGQLKVPEGSTHYSVMWGAIIGGNVTENGRDAYVRFYSKQD